MFSLAQSQSYHWLFALSLLVCACSTPMLGSSNASQPHLFIKADPATVPSVSLSQALPLWAVGKHVFSFNIYQHSSCSQSFHDTFNVGNFELTIHDSGLSSLIFKNHKHSHWGAWKFTKPPTSLRLSPTLNYEPSQEKQEAWRGTVTFVPNEVILSLSLECEHDAGVCSSADTELRCSKETLQVELSNHLNSLNQDGGVSTTSIDALKCLLISKHTSEISNLLGNTLWFYKAPGTLSLSAIVLNGSPTETRFLFN